MIAVDGSQGEGGGQVLRTSLALAALTGHACHLFNIRAGRRRPGLRPQHLTAAHAVAATCGAALRGAALGSRELFFTPAHPARGGQYAFDVGDFAPHGSAGAVTLILQALIWPLQLATEASAVTLTGGTHVPFSPPYEYLAHVFHEAAQQMGAAFSLRLAARGWMSAGQGRLEVEIRPVAELLAVSFLPQPIERVAGLAVVTNLPAHIPQRMANRAHNLLGERGLKAAISTMRERGAGPGAGIMLWVPQGGATSLGRKGVPADKVAERAVAELVGFMDNQAAVDPFLADQLLLPMALAAGTSRLTTSRLTRHTLTQIQLLRLWLSVRIEVSGDEGAPGEIIVHGAGRP